MNYLRMRGLLLNHGESKSCITELKEKKIEIRVQKSYNIEEITEDNQFFSWGWDRLKVAKEKKKEIVNWTNELWRKKKISAREREKNGGWVILREMDRKKGERKKERKLIKGVRERRNKMLIVRKSRRERRIWKILNFELRREIVW